MKVQWLRASMCLLDSLFKCYATGRLTANTLSQSRALRPDRYPESGTYVEPAQDYCVESDGANLEAAQVI